MSNHPRQLQAQLLNPTLLFGRLQVVQAHLEGPSRCIWALGQGGDASQVVQSNGLKLSLPGTT